jgi:hypothetical protein
MLCTVQQREQVRNEATLIRKQIRSTEDDAGDFERVSALISRCDPRRGPQHRLHAEECTNALSNLTGV